MLTVYISAHCRGCDRALQLAEYLQAQRPQLPLQIVDVDSPGAEVPLQIIGTPIYTWNNRILFMGNPSEIELLEYMDRLHADTD